jgi:hypothetical protein
MHKYKKYFLLDIKKLFLLIVVEVIAIILHNLVSALLSIEEPFFFTLAIIVIPLYLAFSVIYTVFFKVSNHKKG